MRNQAVTLRVIVAGLGNELLCDDGVGSHARRAMAGMFPPSVELVEAGTSVWALADMVSAGDVVIAIDAVESGRPAGSIVLLSGAEAQQALRAAGAHGMGLMDVLMLGGADTPRVIVVGVEPEYVGYGMQLSPAVARAVPHVIAAVERIAGAWQTDDAAALPMQMKNRASMHAIAAHIRGLYQ